MEFRICLGFRTGRKLGGQIEVNRGFGIEDWGFEDFVAWTNLVGYGGKRGRMEGEVGEGMKMGMGMGAYL